MVRSPRQLVVVASDGSTLRALELDLRVLLHLEEVRGAKVVVLVPLLVRTLAVEMVTSTNAVSGCSGSISAIALSSSKWPRTVLMAKCLAENSSCVWYGSSLPVAHEGPPLLPHN